MVIGIIDTGIDYSHPDLASNTWRNSQDCNHNGVDDDENGYIDDCHGIDTVNHDSNPMDDHNHGSHVAGIIGAVGNNGIGVVGVNWNISIISCKFLGADISGPISSAIECLEYFKLMKERGENIVATNNSWLIVDYNGTGPGSFSQGLYDAIEEHRKSGILFIASAGNFGLNSDITRRTRQATTSPTLSPLRPPTALMAWPRSPIAGKGPSISVLRGCRSSALPRAIELFR